MDKELERLKVPEIFNSGKYKIPIYQRNYAWEEKEIHQLIEDIDTSNNTYFLGNLVVSQRESDVYEVIDGQQRLTTLHLLKKYLEMTELRDNLYFEVREKSNYTLSIIGTDKQNNNSEKPQSEELKSGYDIIKNYFQGKEPIIEEFKKKLKNVELIHIKVPIDTDLNNYFEIMNTRGEQLELHDIVKSKLLSKLSTEEDKKVGALIWNACSSMDTYVQMKFDLKTREKLFPDDWSELNSEIEDFNKVKEKIVEKDNSLNESKTLFDILENVESEGNSNNEKSTFEENERFESIISFPNFLLQVNNAISKSSEREPQGILDDKNLLKNLESNWNDEETTKNFLYNLLKCKIIFDKYILKREFAKNYKEDGKWSLQCLKFYKDEKNNLKPQYLATFNDSDVNGEIKIKNKHLLVLQSCLRITYTSPKTMYWISLILEKMMNDKNSDILGILEEYCKEKVKNSKYIDSKGFGFARIVFTYLDYILYRDDYKYKNKSIINNLQKKEWDFQFRNSIEHFQPQHPVKAEQSMEWNEDDLDNFGNLALITVSGNSKFSNLPPEAKAITHEKIIEQSLKLIIMKKMMDDNNGKWNKEVSYKHEEEMFRILNQELERS